MDVIQTQAEQPAEHFPKPLQLGSGSSEPSSHEEDHDAELPLSEDVPDWRHIQLLRLRAKEAAKAVHEIRSLQEELQSLKKRHRSASPEPVQDREVSPDRTHHRHKAVQSTSYPEKRQLSYLQLKKAVAACIKRYDCTDRQRISILMTQAELLKNKHRQ